MSVYGYCRISTKHQKMQRQIDNIKKFNQDSIIIQEVYTGTKIVGREKWKNLYKSLKSGDTVIFDSVSRMSRNADEGFTLYEDLYKNGIELIFLKEPHINTATYRNALANGIAMTGTNVDCILEGVNQYLMILAKEQIRLAFEQAQKEVDDLRERTKDGMRVAKTNGKRIGTEQGRKLITKKSISAKANIRKYSKDFDGSLSDVDTMRIIGIARNSYYKYKRELKAELEAEQEN